MESTSSQVLPVGILIFRGFERCRQHFHPQMGKLQFLLRNRSGIGPKLDRAHLIVVKQRVNQQTEAAGPEQD